jgi:hypothetical protein
MVTGDRIVNADDSRDDRQIAGITIPETVKIGALSIDVVVIPGIAMLEDGRYGVYREASQRIEICGMIGHGLMIQTLIHEIIHAIDFDRQIKLKERQVDQIANGLLSFMIDNALVENDPDCQ